MMNRERMTGRSRMASSSGDGPTSLGLSERLERVLAYPLGWLSGLILFLLERKNRNVQLHARQSMLVFGPLSVIWWLVSVVGGLLGKIWLVGWLFGFGLGLLATIIFWIMILLAVWLMIMAFFKPDYRLPFIGRWL